MPRCRSRFAACFLALALLVAPLASAAPIAPAAAAWWTLLAGLLDLFPDGTRTVTAPEGPALEPDGSQNEVVVIDDGSGDSLLPDGTESDACGSCIDPNG